MKSLAALFSACLIFLFTAGAVAAEVSPMTVDGATTVNAAEAKKLFDGGAVFIDVRTDKDWQAGRVPDAVHLELHSAFTEEAVKQAAPAGKAVVLYCNGESCPRSAEASKKAVGWGYKKVYYFRDGLPAWKSAGYPVE